MFKVKFTIFINKVYIGDTKPEVLLPYSHHCIQISADLFTEIEKTDFSWKSTYIFFTKRNGMQR